MIAFLLQTALMMLVTYFAGAFLGCIVRRTFFAHTLEPAAVNAARPAAVAAPSSIAPQPAGITRFERALTGSAAEPAPANPRALAPLAPSMAPSLPVPAPAAPVVARPVAPAPAPAPVPAPSAAAPSPALAAASAAAAAAMAAVATARAQAVAAAPVLPAAMGTSGPATVTASIAPSPVPAPAPTAAPAPVAALAPAAPAPAPAKVSPQDLTRIRAIDEQQQKQLNALGVGTFADIAAWRPEDVTRIGAALKIPGRIEQENWIEQAQILAKGGETYYSRRKLKGELPSSRPTPDEGDRITVRVPAGTRPADDAPITAAPAASPAASLAASPAAMAPVDLKAAAAAAAGAVLAAQASVAPGIKAVAAAALPASEALALPPVVAVPAAQALPAAPAAPIAVAPTYVGSDRPIGTSRDALQRIAGINGEVERLLNVQGVTRYDQIAGWNATDVARFDRLLGFEGRVARENWIEQAQILSKGGETAYSRDMARRAAEAASPVKLADAIQAQPEPERAALREDLSALRSVRSEAYRAPESPGSIGPGAGRAPDDLKRIRGVGVLIEKKLNALGVTRYDQVANWSASDIERFSEKLDFKGRIERENWVEQARILSAGGQTEFSQRVDRGEVETSKPKA